MWVEQVWDIYPRKLDCKIFEDRPSAKIASLEISGHMVLCTYMYISYTLLKSLMLYCHVQEDRATDSALGAIDDYRMEGTDGYDRVVNDAIDEIQKDVSLIISCC